MVCEIRVLNQNLFANQGILIFWPGKIVSEVSLFVFFIFPIVELNFLAIPKRVSPDLMVYVLLEFLDLDELLLFDLYFLRLITLSLFPA